MPLPPHLPPPHLWFCLLDNLVAEVERDQHKVTYIGTFTHEIIMMEVSHSYRQEDAVTVQGCILFRSDLLGPNHMVLTMGGLYVDQSLTRPPCTSKARFNTFSHWLKVHLKELSPQQEAAQFARVPSSKSSLFFPPLKHRERPPSICS